MTELSVTQTKDKLQFYTHNSLGVLVEKKMGGKTRWRESVRGKVKEKEDEEAEASKNG